MDKQQNKANKQKDLISPVVRYTVWNTYCGRENNISKCLCCDATEIIATSFHCGHVQAENNGGKITIDNLRPICKKCNSSVGTTNMLEYINKRKMKLSRNWNGYMDGKIIITPEQYNDNVQLYKDMLKLHPGFLAYATEEYKIYALTEHNPITTLTPVKTKTPLPPNNDIIIDFVNEMIYITTDCADNIELENINNIFGKWFERSKYNKTTIPTVDEIIDFFTAICGKQTKLGFSTIKWNKKNKYHFLYNDKINYNNIYNNYINKHIYITDNKKNLLKFEYIYDDMRYDAQNSISSFICIDKNHLKHYLNDKFGDMIDDSYCGIMYKLEYDNLRRDAQLKHQPELFAKLFKQDIPNEYGDIIIHEFIVENIDISGGDEDRISFSDIINTFNNWLQLWKEIIPTSNNILTYLGRIFGHKGDDMATVNRIRWNKNMSDIKILQKINSVHLEFAINERRWDVLYNDTYELRDELKNVQILTNRIVNKHIIESARNGDETTLAKIVHHFNKHKYKYNSDIKIWYELKNKLWLPLTGIRDYISSELPQYFNELKKYYKSKINIDKMDLLILRLKNPLVVNNILLEGEYKFAHDYKDDDTYESDNNSDNNDDNNNNNSDKDEEPREKQTKIINSIKQ
jgi:hypothetical protein